ncbi:exodeoxyribonuclease III [Polynucleobacter sp. 30F-ANTBAC]|jgi:exodeoxyribonuclease III|uniref:exodeoxyribonuclease III n=1 Tax=Polynucleobacter sp. 30F-ANTBAC TaxID=2689095 RepID=UPI001C0C31F6|nr:exodeoxyribonuclease III [Polynucleobacter sp. 30F-ANTBAC]MBU3600078.1 exodeoxyribonuclease III [Polynucleobacter sp. 30F-ANTBAC]
MLRIITANLNGIRSASKKGFFDWVKIQNPDILCIQELKAQEADLDDSLLAPHGYHGFFQYAQKKGYSGVGLYSKKKPDQVKIGFDDGEFDGEGRYVEARFGKLIVISAYFPSGSSAPERQEAKFRFLDIFMPHLMKLKAEGLEIVLCGDVNIAHQEIDLKNWKGNIKNSGFLPEERDWMTKLLTEIGFVDVYRFLHPNTTDDCYTWWSQRGQAYAKNVGWRIDYHIATAGIAHTAERSEIYKTEKFSDHAPLIIDYKPN